MKVIVLNGSPHMDKGNTALILKPFIEGMKEAGADTRVYHTKSLNIKPCQGEYHCWFQKPGKCFLDDDMSMLLPEIARADILVLATPVYVDGMTGPLKNLLDRLIPIGQPVIALHNGHSRHPDREGLKNGKLVLVSNSGFWEMDNFDPLLAHVRAISKNLGRSFAGALLRPHGPALREMMEQGGPGDDVLKAAKEAGRQLVREDRISPETLRLISRELLPQRAYIDIANRRAREALGRLGEEESSSPSAGPLSSSRQPVQVMGLHIEEMRPEHYDRIDELVRLLPQWFDEKARGKYISLDLQLHRGSVALSGNRLLGFATYTSKYGVGIISWIAVHPDHHRQGIGRQLLQAVERSLAGLGVLKVAVETVGWSDPPYVPYERTRAFYAALGYRVSRTLETGQEASHTWQMCEFSKKLG